MQSSVCTRNSSGGSRRKLFCRRLTPQRCCSGRCSLQDRSTCAKWMVGRPSPRSPSISRLTLPPETIPSCYRRTRHTEFQPHSGRHPPSPFDRLFIMTGTAVEDFPPLGARNDDNFTRTPQGVVDLSLFHGQIFNPGISQVA